MATLTAKHRPYPVYKPSGIEWLKDIPDHWEVAAAKRHFSIQLGKMLQNSPETPTDAEVPYLKAQHVQWFQVVTEDIPTMWASQYEKSRFGIEQGDLLVCEGGEGGRCAILREQIDNCIIQNALHRVRPRGLSLNAFLQYVMSAVNAAGWFDVLNEKATIAHFTKEKFDALTIPSPPAAEQRAIAAFLDRETGKIDALVSKKERLIELLQEKRIALISHAVTRGLNPDAPTKDSGIEWLGKIPANWEVKRLRDSVTDYVGGVWGTEPNGLDDLPCVRVADFDRIRLRVYMNNPTMRAIAPNDRRQRVLSPGDLLLEKSGGGDLQPVGTVMLYDYDTPAVCSNFIARLRIAVEYNPVFLTYFHFALYTIRLNTKSIKQTTGIQNLDTSAYLNELVCFPPLADQNAIAAFLDRETTKLDSLIATVHEAIRLLRELRTALISAAVTGKIDVREDKECT